MAEAHQLGRGRRCATGISLRLNRAEFVHFTAMALATVSVDTCPVHRASTLWQAERSLKRLHEAIGDMQASVTDMWTAASTALDLVGCQDHAQSVQRVPLAEALCICAAAHRDELRLKDAAVRAIGLESSPAEARAMLLAWDAGVFADTHAADAARKALSAAASSGASAVGASGSQGDKKKKKK
jgi:hypothetical protein